MGKPVKFTTPNGEKMVVLSLADYEALVAGDEAEDAADVAAFDEAMARLDSGEDRAMTPDEMAAFHARPSFMRGLRTASGVTQSQLAEHVGITQGFLSDIESGRRNSTTATREKLAATIMRDPETGKLKLNVPAGKRLLRAAKTKG